MAEQAHTPTPWASGLHQCRSEIFAKNGYGRRIAEMRGQGTETNEANAAFIVRACNSHDALVAACKAILPDLESDYIANPSVAASRRRKAHEERIRAALSAAPADQGASDG